jgi:AcrR family transcriptional regulator
MPITDATPPRPQAAHGRRSHGDDRQAQIIAAAERCFARAGFHRTTMKDIAQEAGMSAGNLYRYFVSKDEVVAQLCAKDRADIGMGFAAMMTASDPFAAFEAMARHHLVDEPRERAILVAEIWAEAARNPRIAAIGKALDDDIRARLTDFVESLNARRICAIHADVPALVAVIVILVDGVIANRARCPDFDPAPFVIRICDVLRHGLGNGASGAAAAPAHDIAPSILAPSILQDAS